MRVGYEIAREDTRDSVTPVSTELDGESKEQSLIVTTLTRLSAGGNGGTYSTPQQRYTQYISVHYLIAFECNRAAQSAHATSGGQILPLLTTSQSRLMGR